ncbi:hypothetical protein KXD93_10880 [Mucilaginibacter sp. BJC16-A38]|uniref:hypothetical protein n=1 Tax=Mucilaginibacter phenanthrenivorans TaxID=1234842 RepID=UPI002157E17F|nr:hypothetical protein [Mucilaginibacter phenanthrenivorans]MCR8558152.1 hypothetical protein [Mucilaginibacter phenanthrenivorans]
MKFQSNKSRKIAAFFLLIWMTNICLPLTALALTSGPSQPEVRGFQQASVSDMVDLTSGDFKYNIPLLDVDGYPINLNYQSGTGIDDEASWVGLGWSLNVGSINRQVRGLPDDMRGDAVQTDHYTKPKITVGGRVNVKTEVGGMYSPIKGEGTFSLGIFSDNYTGIGAEVGVNPGISVSSGTDGAMTASLGVGVLSSTASGVNLSPYANLSVRSHTDETTTVNAGLSASLGYNTRSGMKSLSLSGSYGVSATKDIVTADPCSPFGESVSTVKGSADYGLGGSTISYNTEPVSPHVQIPYKTSYGSFSFNVGFAGALIFVGGGGSGYKSVREVQARSISNPAYGFLYSEAGKNQPSGLMDFIREKDNPVIPDMPNLALPVSTPDLFTYTSQEGSGEFRLYRGGTGIYFDNQAADLNTESSAGFDAGFGSYGHGGVSLFNQKTTNTTRKWVKDNAYLASGDFQDLSTATPAYQHAYFKQVGEKTLEDANMSGQLHGTTPLAVQVNGITAGNNFTGYSTLSKIQKQQRQLQRTSISYLTAQEASISGLDNQILNYPINDVSNFTPPANHKPIPVAIPRWIAGGYRQKHHLSEMTVTGPDGKRMVYGIPVYNTKKVEYSFAIGSRTAPARDYSMVTNTHDQIQFAYGTTEPTLGQNKGIDNYYHKDSQPAYATSFLLSGILSPDYVDKTGDGITPDDLGTGIKFNYTMIPKFRWRTPYKNATLNKGLQSDPDDDKASIIYGEKELWYISEVESKTKIAYFITEDRTDGLGVLDFSGGVDNTVHQKRLRQIRLYSKADMSKPIKVVKFDYDYSLCPNTPNSLPAGSGKLTLTKVHFEYGGTTKGQYFPYKFTYNTGYTTTGGTVRTNVGYNTMSTDRWGVYRDSLDNSNFSLLNDEFPYTVQDLYNSNAQIKSSVGQGASLWQLKHISLPTGGGIDVSYESDDYAYVQNKRAMVMTKIDDLIDATGTAMAVPATGGAGLARAKGFKLKMPTGTADNAEVTAWFKKNYLNGSDYIYAKMWVKVANGNSNSQGQDYDFIPAYSQVKQVKLLGGYAYVTLQDRTDSGVSANPMVFSAWQRIKEEYPRYAYPGFDRRVGSETAGQSIENAVRAIFSAFANLSELSQNFYQKAASSSNLYADNVQLNRSFVRLTKIDGHKLGGGVRVAKIVINDDWNEMGGTTAKTYGQAYDYTTIEDGQSISSGVASYEPSVGNDENPLKQPVFYVQKIKGAIGNLFDLEEPFGESFFPSPSVVYSKVTVKDLDNTLVADPSIRTGYTVTECYTAKDFPVQVTVLPMQKFENRPKAKYSFTETSSIDELTMSQGYAIELNDMHGKPKASHVYNQAGVEVSSSVSYYNATPNGTSPMRLKNTVNVVNPDGTVDQNKVIGRDIEFFTDFREQESVNNGKTINVGADIIPAFGIPLPIPHWPSANNSEYKLFRSACAVKVSQYYGIIDSVVKKDNGSTIRTQNLAYDGQTGQPVVTRTQNEFNKDIYSLNIPAYWAYTKMGPAYQNLGMMLSALTTSSTGILPSNFDPYLSGGDELIDPNNTAVHYWVIDEVIDLSTGRPVYTVFPGGDIVHLGPGGTAHVKCLVDRYGRIQNNVNIPGMVKVVRSGYRNTLDAGLTTIVSLNNPIILNAAGNGYRLAMDNTDLTGQKVINASANTYDQGWSVEKPDVHLINNTTPYNLTIDQGGAIESHNSGTWLMNSQYNNHTFTTADHASGVQVVSSYFDAALTRNSIIDISSALIAPTNNNVMGVFSTFTAPTAGTYWIGFDSSINMSFTIDCTNIISVNSHNDVTYFGWNIIPVVLTQGQHSISVELTYSGYNPTATSSIGGGVEIYNNTMAEIQAAGTTGTNIHPIWSTVSAAHNAAAQSYVRVGGVSYYNIIYNDPLHTPYLPPCQPPPTAINPYIYGFLGNWRPYQTKVFQQKRVYNNLLNPANSVVNVKGAGYLNNFFTDWYAPGAGQTPWIENVLAGSWVTANTVTMYDKYGQQLENKDALLRYSAAKFDFNGELPGAVASNAKNREIYASSFEDSQFSPGTVSYLDGPTSREFTQLSSGKLITSLTETTAAHTGNYGVSLPSDSLTLATIAYNGDQKTQAYLAFDANNQYVKPATTTGLYPNGFEPVPGKKYLFNVWVKDGLPNNKSVNVGLFVNGVSKPLICKALVEDWKLLEGYMTFSAAGNPPAGAPVRISLLPLNGATVIIDDMRIHPFDAHMKSYSYDASSMRLMAELDENGFATFYEYDSEGLLIRVKKETERGIMTLKETRTSQKKNTP